MHVSSKQRNKYYLLLEVVLDALKHLIGKKDRKLHRWTYHDYRGVPHEFKIKND